MSEETQPWEDEPEPGVNELGLAGGMFMVAGLLSVVILIWAIAGTLWTSVGGVPNAVLIIFGLWLMAGTAVRIAEVYAA